MKKIRIGIAGFGNRGYSFAVPLLTPEFQNRAEVAAVFDSDPRKLDFARGTFKTAPPPRYFTDREEFFRSGLDLVMITTPQFAHAELAVAALESGLDVFLEKPMARNTAECRAIMEAERKSGRTVFMGFNLRHHPVCRKIAEFVTSGRLGHLQQMVCTDFYSGGYSYFRRWHRLSANSGGLAVEKGCHSIDLLNLYSGSVPARVSAFGGLDRFTPNPDGAKYCSECKKTAECPYYMDMAKAAETTKRNTGIDAVTVNGGQQLDLCVFNSDKDTFDNHTIMIEYANGCRAMLAECFTSSIKPTSGRQFVLNGWDGQLWAELFNRSLRFYPNRPMTIDITPENIQIPSSAGNHGGADNAMLSYVIGSLTEHLPNTKMRTRDGYYAVAVAEAAERAVLEHRIVEIEPPPEA